MHNRNVRQALGILGVLLAGQLISLPGAWAGPISVHESFTTTGTIGTTGVTGAPTVSFEGVTDGTIITGLTTATSTFDLGRFVLTLPSEGTTTFNQTPFAIDYQVNSVAGSVPSPNQVGELQGVLNGTISASGQSQLTAAFANAGPVVLGMPGSTPDTFPTIFQTGDYFNGLAPSLPFVSLSLSFQGHDRMSVDVSGNLLVGPASQVPEPGTLAIFVCGASLFGLKRRLNRRRA